MKKILMAGLALVSLTGVSYAADMPVKARPVVAPVSLWNGFYIGINGGYSWGDWDTTSTTAVFPGVGGLVGAANPQVNGWLFGGQIGYNWQWDRSWLFGLEADFQGTGERASANGGAISGRFVEVGSDFNDVFTNTTAAEWKFPWFATFRGRLGWLPDPEWLLYATGGLAVGNFKYSLASTTTCQRFGPGSQGTIPQATPCNPPPGSPAVGALAGSNSETRVGFAVGAGVEKHFGPNWSVKAEYLYLDFGTTTFTPLVGNSTSIHLRDHVARAGINYRFGL